jgi:hypothetical protein
MKKLILAILITVSGITLAQGSGLKQGLWEIKPIKQVMDGRDMSAEMASAQSRMQQAMANMSPEQRNQMQAMMGRQVAPAGGGARICVSAAMAAKDKPIVDSEGRCEPATVNHSGNKTSFEFNCTTKGRTMVGKGESANNGESVTTRMDMTTTDARGTHTMQSEMQMNYLGSDCQGVKPADQLLKEAQGLAKPK